MKTYRIMVAAYLGLVRAGLVSLLKEWGQGTVVGQAANGPEAIAIAHETLPDLIIMDLHLTRVPSAEGLEALRAIRQNLPEIQVVVLAEPGDNELLPKAVEAGAAGCVLTNQEPAKLYEVLRSLATLDAIDPPMPGAG